ncbi:MAG: LCP family protein, partial [Patescibacteria group bacterium]|nr:LCP family protein [Patescibacteria group bacterium]
MDFKRQNTNKTAEAKGGKKKKWIIIVAITIVLLGGCAFAATKVVDKVAPNSNVFGSLVKSLPGVENKLDGEEDGRINIVLLGMRGKGVAGGGTLADTIMVASIKRIENPEGEDTYKASMVSVPRDMYVTMPGTTSNMKINSVYHYGEEKEKGGGIKAMQQVLEDITGQRMHYGAEVNFAGFKQVVDALGGVEVNREDEFIEPVQFHEEHVCDEQNGGVFIVKSGNFESKIDHRGKVVAQYPLCYNSTEECGGVFTVPAGVSILDGEKALCYVRARATSSDFDRARRQQEVIGQLKQKAVSMGVLADFGKVQELFGAVSGNMNTDMELWEMQRFFDLYQKMGGGVAV